MACHTHFAYSDLRATAARGGGPDVAFRTTRSLSGRSATTQPSRSGAAVSSRTSPEPADVCRSASASDTQNRCGSRSSRPAGTRRLRAAGRAQLAGRGAPVPPAGTDGRRSVSVPALAGTL
jgi:hypothetical protein